MKKNHFSIILGCLFFLGLAIFLYPMISDAYNRFHQSRVIDGYTETLDHLTDDSYALEMEKAEEYNRELAALPDRFHLTEEQLQYYNRLLNMTGSGIMGYVEIPAIQVRLPVYHGTDDAVLQLGIGHVEGTSLPVGGKGTHAVLSGHRGLPSAKLLTDLTQMRTGDSFMIHILNETLVYETDQILTVLPEETDALRIEPDQDLCTLVTCTPYGVNSHRLLVRGHRIQNDSVLEDIRIRPEAVQVDASLTALVIAVLLVLIFLPVLWIRPAPRTRE